MLLHPLLYTLNFVRMKKLKWLSCLLASLCLWSACGSDQPEEQKPEATTVSVTTPVVSNITYESATFTASIEGNASIIKKGFCYATSSNPTIQNTLVEYNSAGTNMTVFTSGLTDKTAYYLRAYVMTSGGNTIYSTETSFTTEEKSSTNELDK